MNEYLKQMNLVACLWIACVSVFAEMDQDDQNTMIANRPNVLLILIDDVGVETVSAYGSEIATPNIDRLAEEGVLFTNGHATPVCTPTRTRLLTGTYNFKHYSRFMHLDKSTYTISEHFKSHGYGTLVAGKWQLVGTGNEKEAKRGKTPEEAGFEESFVWNYEHRSRGSRFWGPTLTHNGQTERFCDSDFGPDLLNSYLTDYIRRKREQPFFIYYPMVLAHDPWVKTPDSMDAETTRERFHGMMKYTDKMIGNVIRVLEEEGLRDDTIIWLIGDNGTHEDVTTRMGDRLVRGGKGLTTDNGTHVPFILSWPQGIHLGQTVDSLVEVLDVFPTLASLLNNHIPPALDGKDLMPVISGYKKDLENTFFKANKGLKRRFNWNFHIKGYNAQELFCIFQRQLAEHGWKCERGVRKLFDTHHAKFKHFGGDCENIAFKAKIHFSRRNWKKKKGTVGKLLSYDDCYQAIQSHFKVSNDDSGAPTFMYI